MAFSEYMNFTTAPLLQIFRSSFGPRSMKGNYKNGGTYWPFLCQFAESVWVVQFGGVSSVLICHRKLCKKSKRIREGYQIKWCGKKCQGFKGGFK